MSQPANSKPKKNLQHRGQKQGVLSVLRCGLAGLQRSQNSRKFAATLTKDRNKRPECKSEPYSNIHYSTQLGGGGAPHGGKMGARTMARMRLLNRDQALVL